MPSPSVNGPIEKVPCPHCGKPNDFRELAESDDKELASTGDVDGSGNQVPEPGQIVLCDHCEMRMEISGVRTMTFVWVRVP